MIFVQMIFGHCQMAGKDMKLKSALLPKSAKITLIKVSNIHYKSLAVD